MDRYLCIHGHFYQPPRENPWLEAIELQDSAYPYHDWNDRITAECYEPNAAARVFGEDGRIARIVNSYSRISFNFGPTLLAWLEDKAPDTYEAIIAADRQSAERFSGHGNAIAQAYGHLIMPLANERDRRTQVRWGLADFEQRFGRRAEGMWLPETACDTATLEALAVEGVRFTVLAPHQARRMRIPGGRWKDVSGGRVDPTQAYRAKLPSGASIDLFFYDGPVSQAVAFEGLLTSGERFANRLVDIFSDEREHAQLAHIATDGETYGHHHRHGDMALAYALEMIDDRDDVELTNYGEFLDRHPPQLEVEIEEGTSWSCAHGVDRWRANCGCNVGREPSQEWRAPLRDSLDWLRDELESPFEERAAELFPDPWATREDYVQVVLDRSPTTVRAFLDERAGRPLDESQRVQALKLLELQRHAMLMYTSCGWFFDELSGIETVQVLQYAARAIQLAGELFGRDFEAPFLDRLEKAPSNRPEHRDGRSVYERHVRPAMVDLTNLAAHYAASSVFEEYGERSRIYCYLAEQEDHQVLEAGRARLAVGRVELTSEITYDGGHVSFGVLHLGDHNLNAGVRPFLGLADYRAMVEEVSEAFRKADFPEVIRRLDRHFGSSPYSIRTLFRDEQRRVVDQILDSSVAEAELNLTHLYEDRAPLMRFLDDMAVPLPKTFRAIAELVLNARLRRDFADETCDVEEVRFLFSETATWGLELDVLGLTFTLQSTIEDVAERLVDHPVDGVLLDRLQRLVDLAVSIPWEVDMWRTQNAFHHVLEERFSQQAARAAEGDDDAVEWVGRIRTLGDQLSVAVPLA